MTNGGDKLVETECTNHRNTSFSETVRKKNEFTRQLAVFEGLFDNELFTCFLRPVLVFNLTF